MNCYLPSDFVALLQYFPVKPSGHSHLINESPMCLKRVNIDHNNFNYSLFTTQNPRNNSLTWITKRVKRYLFVIKLVLDRQVRVLIIRSYTNWLHPRLLIRVENILLYNIVDVSIINRELSIRIKKFLPKHLKLAFPM